MEKHDRSRTITRHTRHRVAPQDGREYLSRHVGLTAVDTVNDGCRDNRTKNEGRSGPRDGAPLSTDFQRTLPALIDACGAELIALNGFAHRPCSHRV